jgi:hypothetical protein
VEQLSGTRLVSLGNPLWSQWLSPLKGMELSVFYLARTLAESHFSRRLFCIARESKAKINSYNEQPPTAKFFSAVKYLLQYRRHKGSSSGLEALQQWLLFQVIVNQFCRV